MAGKILILGESGTGKSHSIKYLNPKETFIINCDLKALPFKGWKALYKIDKTTEGKVDLTTSNMLMTDNPKHIEMCLDFIDKNRPDIKVIVIDTLTLVMVNEFMINAKIKG